MAGVSRPTIDKYIKQGKLSAEKKEDGTIEIDVSELERVFGALVAPGAAKPERKDLRSDTSQVAAILQSQIEYLQQEIDVMRKEKDRLLGIIKKQTFMLAAPKEPEEKKGWLRRWFT